MSNLNALLIWLQHGMFCYTGGGECIYYAVFGGCAFFINKKCIQSYFRVFGAGGMLSPNQQKCNKAMKAAHITIEKNYAMVSNIFCICNSVE